MTTVSDIELAGCNKRYGDIVVLDGVSLKVAQGEFVTVLGPSGCGKTTTLRVIGGFITPDTGTVEVRGRNVTDLPPYMRNIGVVFQNYALWPHMTVAEILGFGLKLRKVPKDEIERRVDRALGMVRLDGLKTRYPRELSGGQQQRVAMARALAIDPEVIILDEPLSNLDRRLREEMRIELKRLQRQLGVTMLFVTHDQEEALSMSDQVVVMSGGRIQQKADPRTVYERPATSFVAGFLGSANFLDGTLVERTPDGKGRVRLANGGTALAVTPERFKPNDAVKVVIRPDWMVIDRAGTAPAESITGTVREIIYEGASVRYGISLPGDDTNLVFIHELSSLAGLSPGQEVSASVRSAVIVNDD